VYQPPAFREDRVEIMHDLMCAQPFATLVTTGSNGMTADHLPLILLAVGSERGILQGHVARPNPVWSDVDPSVDALAIFHGPHHYVTPSWYPSKAAHGKVVPTWNYAVVHAYGSLRAIEDADWLMAHLKALTARQESGRDTPWVIVGFEIEISRLEGKQKMSQNRDEADRAGVIRGLEEEGSEMARHVAGKILD
jgi:transcriptional regulator